MKRPTINLTASIGCTWLLWFVAITWHSPHVWGSIHHNSHNPGHVQVPFSNNFYDDDHHQIKKKESQNHLQRDDTWTISRGGSTSHSEATLASSSTSSRTTSRSRGIPRSASSSSSSLDDPDTNRWTVYPPWNPSRRINDDGFVSGLFHRIPGEWEAEVRLRTAHALHTPCRIRQVPGDGNCLFHSISLCLCHAENGTHWDMKTSLPQLYQHSHQLRQDAVACLSGESASTQSHNNNNHKKNHNGNGRRLVLQGHESVPSRELVEAAARQYGLTRHEYCRDMLQESVWGGGPEIVALANVLRRPIHVYELRVVDPANQDSETDDDLLEYSLSGSSYSSSSSSPQFCLRRMACFGSPKFDYGGRRRALHILSADSRFPDIVPGKQLSDGNHFLAVFPIDYEDDDDEEDDDGTLPRRRKRLRGGSFFFGPSRHETTTKHRLASFWNTRRDEHNNPNSMDKNSAHKDHEVMQDPLHRDLEEDEDEGPFQWMGGWWRRTFPFLEQ